MRSMISVLSVVCAAMVFSGCAPMAAQEPAGEDVAVASEALVRSNLDPNEPPLQLDPGLIGGGGVIGTAGVGGGGVHPPNELKPCTATDRDNCQQCQDDCQAGICSTDQGDDRAGGCVGSFCPNRCQVCILSCSQVRACVRCFGR